jgi:signal transduction histidine kinase
MRLINYIRRHRSSIPLALLLIMLAPIAAIVLGMAAMVLGVKACYRYLAKELVNILRKHRPSIRLILLVTTLVPILLTVPGVILITKYYWETSVLISRAEEHAINHAKSFAADYKKDMTVRLEQGKNAHPTQENNVGLSFGVFPNDKKGLAKKLRDELIADGIQPSQIKIQPVELPKRSDKAVGSSQKVPYRMGDISSRGSWVTVGPFSDWTALQTTREHLTELGHKVQIMTQAERLSFGITIAGAVESKEGPKGMAKRLSLGDLEPLPANVDVKEEGDRLAVEVGGNMQHLLDQAWLEDSDIRILDYNGVIVASTVPNESTASKTANHPGTSWYSRSDIREALAGNPNQHLYELSQVEREEYKEGGYTNLIRYFAGQLDAEDIWPRTSPYRVHANVPIVGGNKLLGVVSVSLQPTTFWGIMAYFFNNKGRIPVLIWASVILTLAIVLSLFIAFKLTEPIYAIRDRAKRSQSGNPGAFKTFLARPVTRELSEAYDAVSASVNKLEETEQLTRDYADHVVHEARNQIASSAGAIELITKDSDSMGAKETKLFLSTIHANLVKLSDLLDDLQTRARDTLGVSTEPNEVNMPSVLESIKQTKGETDFAITFDTNIDAIRMTMPAVMFESCLTSLVTNAQTAGAKCIRMSIERDAFSHALQITVADDGPGVPESIRQYIFDKGFTTKTREEGNGGLGLFGVRSLLTAHGGSIDLLDSPSGAAFLVEIPHSS